MVGAGHRRFYKGSRTLRRAFEDRRTSLPEQLDYPTHPAAAYFRGVIQDSRPEIALQAVNGVMQLGIHAIDSLLDAIETGHPLMAASAIHGLFHIGQCLTNGMSEITPLIVTHSGGFRFNNSGTCNATIANLELVSVPRPMYAELTATFGHLDFDLFTAPCSFEIWHTPVAWFAIDYFRRAGRVDWIGLAAGCDGSFGLPDSS